MKALDILKAQRKTLLEDNNSGSELFKLVNAEIINTKLEVLDEAIAELIFINEEYIRRCENCKYDTIRPTPERCFDCGNDYFEPKE